MRHALYLTLALTLACTPSNDDDDVTPTDAGTNMDSGTGGQDAGMTGMDGGMGMDAGPDLTRDPSCQGSWVVVVNGRLQTEAGAGIEAKAQICIRLHPVEQPALPPPVRLGG